MKVMPQVTKADVKHYAVKSAKYIGLVLAADVALLGMMVGMGRLEQKYQGPGAVNDAKASLNDDMAIRMPGVSYRQAGNNTCQWHHGQFVGVGATMYTSPAEPCNAHALAVYGPNLAQQ